MLASSPSSSSCSSSKLKQQLTNNAKPELDPESDSDESNPEALETLGLNEETTKEDFVSTPPNNTMKEIEKALSTLQALEKTLNPGLNFNPFSQAISDLRQVHTFHSFVLVGFFENWMTITLFVFLMLKILEEGFSLNFFFPNFVLLLSLKSFVILIFNKPCAFSFAKKKKKF